MRRLRTLQPKRFWRAEPWRERSLHHRRLFRRLPDFRRVDRVGYRRPSPAAAVALRTRGARDHAPVGARRRASAMTVTANDNTAKDRTEGRRRRRILVFIPLAIFLPVALLLLIRLGAGDASRIPSALIGHPAPVTVLPPLASLDR